MLTYGVGDCVGKMTGLGVNQHRVTFWGGCQDFDSGLPLTANDWNFVAASYDGARLVVNVNGDVAQGQLALATVRTDTVWLGRETRTAGGSFDAQFLGALDDVRIYNRALSTTELAELFALGPDAAATNQPPRITLHPSSRAAVAGQTIELSVSARGEGGVVYQWLKDGDPLIGQTNSLLRLTNVGAGDEGGYKAVATNPFGSATSEPARLWLTDFQAGLLAHLPLDGNAADATGRNPPGLVQGSRPVEDRFGVPGAAMQFDGIDDVIIVSPTNRLPGGNGERTMAVWFRGDDSREAPGGLVHYGSGNVGTQSGLGFHGGNALFWGGTQDFAAGRPAIGEWHFFAAAYRPDGTLVVCLNGQLLTNQLGQLQTISTTNFWIGAVTVDEGASFVRRHRGAVDDVRIYDRALAPEELELLYTIGREMPAVVIAGDARSAPLDRDFELPANVVGAAPLRLQWSRSGAAPTTLAGSSK
ncbi:MAG TPA: immunoglobulin domain-containing protein, partial [Lacipirellulaceae bacterium]|nr:immunoglobulin domain-containing protein [Lacipirellulaceae bacterium]